MAIFSTIGNVIAGDQQRDAAREAGDVSEANNIRNVELAAEVRDDNKEVLSPFYDSGYAANNQINALLGLNTQQEQQSAFAPARPAANQYGIGDQFLSSPFGQILAEDYGFSQGGFGGIQPSETYGANLPSAGGPISAQQQPSQNDAFQTFRDSTGYQFRLGEALDGVNSGYAGAGVLQSGAAQKAIATRAAQEADNTFYGQYLPALQSQQAVGAGAASSLAGVGQNFAGTVINANNQNATNQGNALLAQGQASAGISSGIGNALGQVAGTFLGGFG